MSGSVHGHVVQLATAGLHLIQCLADKCGDEIVLLGDAKRAKQASLDNKDTDKDTDIAVSRARDKQRACMAGKCRASLMATLEALKATLKVHRADRSAHGLRSAGIDNMVSTLNRALRTKGALSGALLAELGAMLELTSPMSDVM